MTIRILILQKIVICESASMYCCTHYH